MCAAPHVVLGAQHFSPQAISFCCVLFSDEGGKKNMVIFFLTRRRRKKQRKTFNFFFFGIRRRREKEPIFLFALIDKNKLTTFAIRRWVLLFFRRFLLFTVAENKLKGVFRYSSELFIRKHVSVFAVG